MIKKKEGKPGKYQDMTSIYDDAGPADNCWCTWNNVQSTKIWRLNQLNIQGTIDNSSFLIVSILRKVLEI